MIPWCQKTYWPKPSQHLCRILFKVCLLSCSSCTWTLTVSMHFWISFQVRNSWPRVRDSALRWISVSVYLTKINNHMMKSVTQTFLSVTCRDAAIRILCLLFLIQLMISVQDLHTNHTVLILDSNMCWRPEIEIKCTSRHNLLDWQNRHHKGIGEKHPWENITNIHLDSFHYSSCFWDRFRRIIREFLML